MLRDKLKSEEYFINFIYSQETDINDYSAMLMNGDVREKQIPFVKESRWRCQFHKLIAEYSLGVPINELKTDFQGLIKQSNECTYWLKGYFKPISIISLGILLNDAQSLSFIKERFQQTGEKKWLFDFLLNYGEKPNYLPTEGPLRRLKFYLKLCDALKNDKDATSAISDYLSDWYRCQSYEYWYGDDKSESDTYFGYWSFEAGALAAILGVDPERLKDKKYFPKDLVDYYNQNK